MMVKRATGRADFDVKGLVIEDGLDAAGEAGARDVVGMIVDYRAYDERSNYGFGTLAWNIS